MGLAALALALAVALWPPQRTDFGFTFAGAMALTRTPTGTTAKARALGQGVTQGARAVNRQKKRSATLLRFAQPGKNSSNAAAAKTSHKNYAHTPRNTTHQSAFYDGPGPHILEVFKRREPDAPPNGKTHSESAQ